MDRVITVIGGILILAFAVFVAWLTQLVCVALISAIFPDVSLSTQQFLAWVLGGVVGLFTGWLMFRLFGDWGN